MSAQSIAKQVLPSSLYNLGRQGYGYIRYNYLSTVIGCDTTQKIVALTFDDGPGEYTPQLLHVLDEYQVKATFFLLGKNVSAFPEIAKNIVRQGHAIGNHTFSHPRLSQVNPLLVGKELRECQKTISTVIGTPPRIMRPPQGAQSISSFFVTRLMGYTPIHWSTSGGDWLDDPAIVVAENVLRKLKPGGIILLHDALQPLNTRGEPEPEYERRRDREPTIAAVRLIIQKLQSEGYQFVTLPQLLQIKPLIKKVWFEKGKIR